MKRAVASPSFRKSVVKIASKPASSASREIVPISRECHPVAGWIARASRSVIAFPPGWAAAMSTTYHNRRHIHPNIRPGCESSTLELIALYFRILDILARADHPGTGSATGRRAAMNVADWLKQLGLDRYDAAFQQNDISAVVLPSLTAE